MAAQKAVQKVKNAVVPQQVTDPGRAGPAAAAQEVVGAPYRGGSLAGLVATLLEALARAGGFDAAFICTVERAAGVLTVAHVFNAADVEVSAGMSVDLPPDYPDQAYYGVNRSQGAEGGTADGVIARALGLGTYASVPIVTADYRLFGTLCGAARAPREVADDTIAVMEHFARLIVDQMARDGARAADRRAAAAEGDLRDRLEFLAQAEHMLKTPLAVIAGFVEQLRAGEVPEADRRAVLDVVARNTTTVIEQVGRLLMEVTADVRARDAHLVSADLVPQITTLITAFNAAGGGRQIRFEAPTPHLHAHTDPDLVVQIVGHLLDNAVKYSEPDTTIEVGVRAYAGNAEITVADQGVGLPAGVDIFAAFQRGPTGDAPTGAAPTGAGLGLHIVANLVHAMGGQISAAANHDKGSTFTVTLPLPLPGTPPPPACGLP